MFLLIVCAAPLGFLLLKLLARKLGAVPSSSDGLSVVGSNVCITGGSEGIGLSIAEECVKRGAASVTIMARSPSKLVAATKYLRDVSANLATSTTRHTDVHTVECDVSDPKSVRTAFAGRDGTDLLVCCAGVCISDVFENLTCEDIKQVLDTNLAGSMYCVNQVLPGMMQRQKGAVCLMLSQAAQIAVYGFTSYSASKFGLVGFAQCLQTELHPFNILISVAFPADVDTPGYVKEVSRKPEITKAISDTSGLYDSGYVAERVIQGIEEGDSRITFGVTGSLLDIATCGFNPAVSLIRTICEVLFGGVARVVGVALAGWWNYKILKHPETAKRLALAQKGRTAA